LTQEREFTQVTQPYFERRLRMSSDRSYWIGPVQITKHFLDWEQLGPDFGDFARLTFQRLTAILPCTDHIYLNPAYSVRAAPTVPENVFLPQAKRACILWAMKMDRMLGRGTRRRAAKRYEPGERMLIFSGVLFLKGCPAHTKRINESISRPVQTSC